MNHQHRLHRIIITIDGQLKRPFIQTLDEVIQCLSDFKLKLTGNSLLDDVWTGDDPIKSEMYSHSEAEFNSDCKALWNLKDLLKVVESLNDVLSRKVSQMSDVLIPPSRQYGIASIPNETFLQIMDFAAISCTDCASIMDLMKNLSSVSRRFRGGVISTTSFWNYWDNTYCLDDAFQRRLARTKNAPIFLDFFVRSRISTMKSISKIIMPYKTRCHHLTLQVPRDLRNEFFAEWAFPNLSSVKIIGTIPPPGSFPTISSLTLCTTAGEYIHPRDYRVKVTSLLRSMPCLTELDLDLSMVGNTIYSDPEFPTVDLSTVDFPSIITFKIGNYRDLLFLKGKYNNLLQSSMLATSQTP